MSLSFNDVMQAVGWDSLDTGQKLAVAKEWAKDTPDPVEALKGALPYVYGTNTTARAFLSSLGYGSTGGLVRPGDLPAETPEETASNVAALQSHPIAAGLGSLLGLGSSLELATPLLGAIPGVGGGGAVSSTLKGAGGFTGLNLASDIAHGTTKGPGEYVSDFAKNVAMLGAFKAIPSIARFLKGRFSRGVEEPPAEPVDEAGLSASRLLEGREQPRMLPAPEQPLLPLPEGEPLRLPAGATVSGEGWTAPPEWQGPPLSAASRLLEGEGTPPLLPAPGEPQHLPPGMTMSGEDWVASPTKELADAYARSIPQTGMPPAVEPPLAEASPAAAEVPPIVETPPEEPLPTMEAPPIEGEPVKPLPIDEIAAAYGKGRAEFDPGLFEGVKDQVKELSPAANDLVEKYQAMIDRGKMPTTKQFDKLWDQEEVTNYLRNKLDALSAPPVEDSEHVLRMINLFKQGPLSRTQRLALQDLDAGKITPREAYLRMGGNEPTHADLMQWEGRQETLTPQQDKYLAGMYAQETPPPKAIAILEHMKQQDEAKSGLQELVHHGYKAKQLPNGDVEVTPPKEEPVVFKNAEEFNDYMDRWKEDSQLEGTVRSQNLKGRMNC